MLDERASGQESTNFTERMPSLAHGIEQMLRDYGPFTAQLVQKSFKSFEGGMAYWGEVVAIWRGEDDVTWVRVENTSIPGVRAMDELVASLFHVHPERSALTHPCPLCPLDAHWPSRGAALGRKEGRRP